MSAVFAFALAKAAIGLAPGSYAFVTNDLVDGKPVCTEQWDFAAKGKMTVYSGQEISRSTYRFERNRDGEWLVTTYVSTNGQPDCMGNRVTDPPVGQVRRTFLLRFKGGGATVCPPPGHTDKGVPFISGCFATLTRKP
ncbi:MAG: hypothetical protein ACKOPQ_04950 [Novosphingobium sp.]